ncbi:glycosyltransferase family 4 protein [Paracoccus jeotgali]|uniref:Glycosyl transferase family 1 n=1 Tax=Paracoccus jeotgali TaxID=2065379 RepID=A0A2K9ML48_9RHOB|nr:glycosyltransferase family 4 protein [Paracoccus jeotgali]AUM75335.1 hypothetical protein CYR75_14460 [Paracoccus jeotgali]
MSDSEYLAEAADTLHGLGRTDSDYSLLKVLLDNGALNVARTRRCLSHAKDAADLEVSLKASKRLIELLKSTTPVTQTTSREIAAMEGSDLFGLSLLDGLDDIVPDPVPSVPGRLLYILHHSMPYLTNGYAMRSHGLARGMNGAGIDLLCLTRPGFPLDTVDHIDSLPDAEVIDGVPYLRDLYPKRLGRDRSQAYLSEAADQIERRLRSVRPQAVLVASNYIAALPALLAARRCGVPIAYEVRGFWELSHLARDPAYDLTLAYKTHTALESRTAAACDHVFTLASPMKDELVKRGVAADRISLLPNSCDPDRFQPLPRDERLAAAWKVPSDVPVIGYIGSFVGYEGLDDLTRACARLRAEGHRFRLVLVGGNAGPVEAEIEGIAKQTGLDDWLIMPGRVPHDDVDAWYSLIDIAPFPRKPHIVTELVTPLKPLEAMAMGKAVVMSSVRAMAEMVQDGETGLLFRKGDVDDLSQQLARLIEKPVLRRSIGHNARSFVQRERTWDTMGQRVKTWMDQL